MLGTQAPYFYRFKFGNAEATIVSDGPLPLGDPSTAFLGLTKDEIARQLSSNYLPLENAVLEQNALIVNTGNQVVLFDTGMGSAKDFGPTTGKLLASMKPAGIDPKDVDAVVMSHGISIISVAMSATTARATSRTRSSTSSNRIWNSGPTRSWPEGR